MDTGTSTFKLPVRDSAACSSMRMEISNMECLSPGLRGDIFCGNATNESVPNCNNGQTFRRSYNYKKRKAALPVERFVKSKLCGIMQSENDLRDVITNAARCCKHTCSNHFLGHITMHSLYQKRNEFHSVTNQSDRRMCLSGIVTKNSHGKLTLLGIRVCANFITKALMISRNQLYGVLQRVDSNLPVSAALNRGTLGMSLEENVCGWLLDLASAKKLRQMETTYSVLH